MTGKLWMARALGLAVVVGMALAASSPAEAARKRIEFEELEIIVDVPKPEIAVFITRQNLNESYDLQLKESFLPKIVDAVKRAPF